MSGKAARIVLTEKQLKILRRMSKATTVSRRLKQRVDIVLLAYEHQANEEITKVVELNRKQVGLWRRRWQESFAALVSIECCETEVGLYRAIEDVLNDAPRAGVIGTYTAEQVTQIMALACEPPEKSDRPIAQ